MIKRAIIELLNIKLYKDMKKSYIAPEIEELNVVTEQMVAASIPVVGDKEVDTEEDGAQLGGGRRGEWGNLWK